MFVSHSSIISIILRGPVINFYMCILMCKSFEIDMFYLFQIASFNRLFFLKKDCDAVKFVEHFCIIQ